MSMTPFERRSVWLTTAGTLITGVVYWWMKEFLTPAEPWAVVNHPLQPWVLKAHILIAPLQVFAVGLITSRHVWRHFRLGVKKGRTSGLVAAGTFVALVFSGYALQVVTTGLLIQVLAWSHLVLGVVYSVGVAAHWPATRKGQETEEADRLPPVLPRAVGFGGPRVPSHERRRRTGPRPKPEARPRSRAGDA